MELAACASAQYSVETRETKHPPVLKGNLPELFDSLDLTNNIR